MKLTRINRSNQQVDQIDGEEARKALLECSREYASHPDSLVSMLKLYPSTLLHTANFIYQSAEPIPPKATND